MRVVGLPTMDTRRLFNSSIHLAQKWRSLSLNDSVYRSSGSLLMTACRKLEPDDTMEICEPTHNI